MFIGHFAVGLGLKKPAPDVSLGTLFLAAQFIDLLWPTFLLAGWEQVELAPGNSGPPLRFTHYPLTHSLLMVFVWALLVGGAYFVMRRRVRGAVVVGLAVVSHWVLDLIVHHPDLPLRPAVAPPSSAWGFGAHCRVRWRWNPCCSDWDSGVFCTRPRRWIGSARSASGP